MKIKTILRCILTLLVLFFSAKYICGNYESFITIASLGPGNILAIFLITVMIIILSGLTLHLAITAMGYDLSPRVCIRLTVFGSLSDYILTKSSYIFKGIYLKKKHAVPYRTFFVLIFLLTVISIISCGLMGLTGLFILHTRGFPVPLVLLFFFSAVLFTGSLLIAFSPSVLRKLFKMRGWQDKDLSLSDFFHEKRLFLFPVMLVALLHIIMSGLRLVLLSNAFSDMISFPVTLIMASTAHLSFLLSITPAAIGIREALMSLSADLLGNDFSSVMIISATERVVTVFGLIIFALIDLLFRGQNGPISRKTPGTLPSSDNMGKLTGYGASVLLKDLVIKLGILSHTCHNSPYTFTLSLTDRCNSKCLTCRRWENKTDPDELDKDAWIRLISSICEWTSPCYLTFTGGEPFVKEGIFDILSHASSKGAYVTVSTNGLTLDKENCQRLIETGTDFVLFSLNSITPEIHDLYKGVQSAHDKACNAIRYLSSRNAIKIGTTLVVTKDNYRTLNDFALWSTSLGADCVNFQLIRDVFGPNFSDTPSFISSMDNPLWRIDDMSELEHQIHLLKDSIKSGLPVITPESELEGFLRYFRDPYSIPRRKGCDIGWRNLIISAIGEAKLCYMHPSLGNIKHASARDIWFKAETQQQREAILKCTIPCVSACLRKYTFREKYRNFVIRLTF